MKKWGCLGWGAFLILLLITNTAMFVFLRDMTIKLLGD